MSRPRGVCLRCRKHGPLWARGLCGPCYEGNTHDAASQRRVAYESLRGRPRRAKPSKFNPWPYRGDA